ncbi:MAG: outer membrane lipoprotein carrier protein LolA [Planctomycetes bacterium]|nr:outer membrane lipoprotein carrier protein LolA [Planctomycetota bacterium]
MQSRWTRSGIQALALAGITALALAGAAGEGRPDAEADPASAAEPPTAAESKPARAPQRKLLEGAERAEFLARVEEKMAAVQSIAAEFAQEKELRLFETALRSSGVILFQRPDRLRWEIREPFRSILVASGSTAGKYEYTGGERRELRLKDGGQAVLIVLAQMRAWFQGRFEDRGRHFDVDVSDSPSPLIILRPRLEAMKKSLEAVEIELRPDLSAVARLRIAERGGDSTKLTFREIRRDADLPADLFTVSDPSPLDMKRIEDAERITPSETS